MRAREGGRGRSLRLVCFAPDMPGALARIVRQAHVPLATDPAAQHYKGSPPASILVLQGIASASLLVLQGIASASLLVFQGITPPASLLVLRGLPKSPFSITRDYPQPPFNFYMGFVRHVNVRQSPTETVRNVGLHAAGNHIEPGEGIREPCVFPASRHRFTLNSGSRTPCGFEKMDSRKHLFLRFRYILVGTGTIVRIVPAEGGSAVGQQGWCGGTGVVALTRVSDFVTSWPTT